jgi:hypothetical protein
MNGIRLKELLEHFQAGRPAEPDEIEAFERAAAISLPPEYREFLQYANGGEGFIGPNSYAMLWKIGEVLLFNREYQVHEYAPGLLLFASSGGGEAFAFDLRPGEGQAVVSVPFVGVDLSEIWRLGETFDGFLEQLARE